jgi:hypothetical protein
MHFATTVGMAELLALTSQALAFMGCWIPCAQDAESAEANSKLVNNLMSCGCQAHGWHILVWTCAAWLAGLSCHLA